MLLMQNISSDASPLTCFKHNWGETDIAIQSTFWTNRFLGTPVFISSALSTVSLP